MKAIITVGISASGKSFWAENYTRYSKEWAILCRDSVRRQILEKELDHPLEPGELWRRWKFKRENEVSVIIENQLTACVEKQINVIFADTNLNKNRLDQLIKKLENHGYEVEVKTFDTSLEEAWKRDAARADGVGHEVIWKQYRQFKDMMQHRKYVSNGVRSAIMVDIDGTLAHMKDRGPFDWHKVGNDDLDHVVYAVVRGFYMQGYEIIIMSGRDSVCRKETEEWLFKHSVPYTELFMRKENDMRKDSVVKEELFWMHVANNFDVACVIDDRPQVTRLWREIGLKVLDVGDPLESF